MTIDFTVDDLKFILANLCKPAKLNGHPWTDCKAVRMFAAQNPIKGSKGDGHLLALTLAQFFKQTMPTTPPRQGKRLDSKWGQFGILAAQYFAPFVYGSAYPNSLRDACGRIDQSIAQFVFNKRVEELSARDMEQYQVVSAEAETLPMSTISDWHIVGLKKFLDSFLAYEQSLPEHPEPDAVQTDDPDDLTQQGKSIRHRPHGQSADREKSKRRKTWRWVILCLLGILLLVGGSKGVRIYNTASELVDDLKMAENFTVDSSNNRAIIQSINYAQPLISKMRVDVTAFHNEVKPFLWMCKGFAWVPKYGGTIAQAESLLEFAEGLTFSADYGVKGILPIVNTITSDANTNVDISSTISQLAVSQPDLEIARTQMDLAMAAYSELDVQQLSPRLRWFFKKYGNLIELYDDSLTIGVALPRILGGTEEGPKTYIIMIQNSDELRATGGFITGLATVVISNGEILSYKVEDSYSVDNPDQYYPPAPWQLANYMNSDHWVFRDSNWSPDFPTASGWAEMFLATSRNYSVDGFITIDQQAIRYLLMAIGPVSVEGVPYKINSDNVLKYMWEAKSAVPSEQQKEHRKDFMSVLAQAILEKFKQASDIPWKKLITKVATALDERHILLQLDDQSVAAFLSEHHWDGAIRTTSGDFLMVVDSNIGFNKVNAVVNEDILYEVDLTDLAYPTTSLTVNIQNDAEGNPECTVEDSFGGADNTEFENKYVALINHCYLDYLRVYKPLGVTVTGSAVHSVPAAMVANNVVVPARVDTLLNEDLPAFSIFGTLLYVPGMDSVSTGMTFALPAGLLHVSDSQTTYSLLIQKQAGTVATPVKLVIHLPEGAVVEGELPMDAVNEDNTITLLTNLQEDVEISVTFTGN
jgi:hypothetical protein